MEGLQGDLRTRVYKETPPIVHIVHGSKKVEVKDFSIAYVVGIGRL